MCFSPQRRAIFRHLNFKKWSRTVSFLTCSLPNVPFATAACIFSTSARTKVVQTDVMFCNILTSKCTFRHSGIQFFDIWTSKSAPGPSVFVTFSLPNVLFATAACNFWFIRWPPDSAPAALTGLLFDWPDTRIIEKTQHFATSLTFGADVSSFFLTFDTIASFVDWLDDSTAELCICFSTLHIVGSFYLNFLR